MDTKEQIITLLKSTNRNGMDNLINFLETSGFFESPASTKFHGCYPGGLADHSLGVFNILTEQARGLQLDAVTGAGQEPCQIKPENIIIATLLHDVCKAGAYIPNGDTYKWNKQQPKGHALLSIERIKQFITMDPIEELMIKFHMGVYGLNEFYKPGDWQSGEYPLRGDDSLSKEEKYGKSLVNAWYHNPICKLMYFCDELETLRDKTK